MKRDFTYLKKKVTAEFLYSVTVLFWNQKGEGKDLRQVLQQNAIMHLLGWGWGQVIRAEVPQRRQENFHSFQALPTL